MNAAAEKMFAEAAADKAMRAAADYLRNKGITLATDAEIDRLIKILKSQTVAGLPAALDDAKAAYDAGMSGVASVTFAASMRMIGVRAAQEFLG